MHSIIAESHCRLQLRTK